MAMYEMLIRLELDIIPNPINVYIQDYFCLIFASLDTSFPRKTVLLLAVTPFTI